MTGRPFVRGAVGRRIGSPGVGIALLASVAIGCAADGPADVRDAVARRVAPTTRPAALAMRPMLGDWIIDAEATLAANPRADAAMRDALRVDLRSNPFELQITDAAYVSRSSRKVIHDRYKATSVDGDAVTITLHNDGDPPGRVRQSTLQLGDGRLFLRPAGAPLTYVFLRVGGG